MGAYLESIYHNGKEMPCMNLTHEHSIPVSELGLWTISVTPFSIGEVFSTGHGLSFPVKRLVGCTQAQHSTGKVAHVHWILFLACPAGHSSFIH